MLGKHLKLLFLGSLVVLAIAVVLAAWGFPAMIKNQIQKNVQIENSSMMFDKWQKTPMPLTFSVYIFNVTNPAEVNKGENPKLAEIGPYVYDQYREKTILGFGENDTVRYMQKKTFIFNANASGALTEDDQVTVIHFSYMASILSVLELMPSLVPMVNQALQELFTNLTDPFLRVKVKDLLFDGIYLNCEGESSALGLVCGKIRSDKPPTMWPSEDGKGFYWSMFGHMNRTESGPYDMIRGTKNMYELGHIVAYKDKKVMNNWGDKYCGQLNGSDSSIFPPIDESHVPQRLYTFEPEICRSIYASLVGKRTIFNMTAYYYEISEDVLAAKSTNKNNKCYCRRNWSAKHDGCLVMGVLNLLPCQGAPAIASLPHFYLGSEELLEYFDGSLNPDKEKHNTFVYIEPTSGVILQGVRRLQFNVELRNTKGVPQLENVTTGLFPLLWIEEGATLPSSIVLELQQSRSLVTYVEVLRWILLVGAALAAFGCAVALLRSGALPWPRQKNSVSFILSPSNLNTDKAQ